jgi:hypothetical protein
MSYIFQDEDMILIGNTPGTGTLSVGLPTTTGQFGRHLITSGIVKLYEGVTICYPKKLGILKVLATSTNQNPGKNYMGSFSKIIHFCSYLLWRQ